MGSVVSGGAGPVKRGQVWYYRKRVPKDLKALLSTWILSRSLQTRQLSIALLRFGWLDLRITLLFDWLRRAMTQTPPLTEEHLREVFHRQLKVWLGLLPARDTGVTLPAPMEPGESLANVEQLLRNEHGELYDVGVNALYQIPELEAWQSALDERQKMQVGGFALRTVREHYRQTEAMMRTGAIAPAHDVWFAEALSGDAAMNTSGSDSVGGSALSSLAATQHQPTASLNAAMQLSRAVHSVPSQHKTITRQQDQIFGLRANFQQFQSETGEDWGRRRYKFEDVSGILCQIFGETFDIRSLTPHDVRHVKDLVRRQPIRATINPKYKNLPITEQVALAEKDGDPQVSYKTANDKLSNISLWFKWAKDNLYIEANLFESIKVATKKDDRSGRAPFSEDQLKCLFSSPYYTGIKSDHHWRQVGEKVYRNARYWTPLISAHSGMRLDGPAPVLFRRLDRYFAIKEDKRWHMDIPLNLKLKHCGWCVRAG